MDQSSEEKVEAMVRSRRGGRASLTPIPVTGKRHDRQRRAESKIDAKELVHALLAEVDSTGGQSLAREHMTFLDLATYFEKQYLKPAEYVDGRKGCWGQEHLASYGRRKGP